MPPLASPTATSGLADAVYSKLQQAVSPLKLADVAKGLPRPKKMKVPEFQAEVREILEEEVRIGRAFSYPSAKKDVLRYWGKDEKQFLRDKATGHATVPQTISELKKKLAKEVKGVDAAFLEVVVRELIGEDKLFEHPSKTKKSAPLFGVSPPPPPPPPLPPLEQPKHKKAVAALIKSCQKLLAAAGVSTENLFQTLRTHLIEPGTNKLSEANGVVIAPEPDSKEPEGTQPPAPNVAMLDELILKAVANAPVVSLADLRGEMPQEFRGKAFDEAVIRLADAHQVVVSQDADPTSLSEAERAGCVQDGENVLTTISARR